MSEKKILEFREIKTFLLFYWHFYFFNFHFISNFLFNFYFSLYLFSFVVFCLVHILLFLLFFVKKINWIFFRATSLILMMTWSERNVMVKYEKKEIKKNNVSSWRCFFYYYYLLLLLQNKKYSMWRVSAEYVSIQDED